MKYKNRIQNSIDNLIFLQNNNSLWETVNKVIEISVETINNGGRILLCGNGGSASDAQHIAAELSGRFKLERAPIDAEALHVNSSYITAVANDYGYDIVYERLIEAKGRIGDVLIAISTSGNSENIIRAVNMAKNKKMKTIALTGSKGGKLNGICDYLINVPSDDTPLIQEMHIVIGHIICEEIENKICK
jgi:D-sedoheptulose 7-phosphate isomerase